MIERRQHTEHGDRDVAMGGETLRTVVGSGVHGIAIAGTDHHDEIGVFVEPPEAVVAHRQHWGWAASTPAALGLPDQTVQSRQQGDPVA